MEAAEQGRAPSCVGGAALLAINIVLFAVRYAVLKSGWKSEH